MPLRCLVFYKQ